MPSINKFYILLASAITILSASCNAPGSGEVVDTPNWESIDLKDQFGHAIRGEQYLRTSIEGKVLRGDLQIRATSGEAAIKEGKLYIKIAQPLVNPEDSTWVLANMESEKGQKASMGLLYSDGYYRDQSGLIFKQITTYEGEYAFSCAFEQKEGKTTFYFTLDTRGVNDEMATLGDRQEEYTIAEAKLPGVLEEPDLVEQEALPPTYGDRRSRANVEYDIPSSSVEQKIKHTVERKRPLSRTKRYRSIQFVAAEYGRSFSDVAHLGDLITEKVPGKKIYRYKITGIFNDYEVKDIIEELEVLGYRGAFEG